MASQFYAEPPPQVQPSWVLCFAAEELRASKEVVLAAVASSCYEFESAGDALSADAYVAAWAGAPVGAAPCRELSKTFTRLLKSDFSVEYMDANWRALSEERTSSQHADPCRKFLPSGLGCHWACHCLTTTQCADRVLVDALTSTLSAHCSNTLLQHAARSASASRRPSATCSGPRARSGTGSSECCICIKGPGIAMVHPLARLRRGRPLTAPARETTPAMHAVKALARSDGAGLPVVPCARAPQGGTLGKPFS
jgi:hypothetical protein